MVDDVICCVLNLDLLIGQFMTVRNYYYFMLNLCSEFSGIADIGG